MHGKRRTHTGIWWIPSRHKIDIQGWRSSDLSCRREGELPQQRKGAGRCGIGSATGVQIHILNISIIIKEYPHS
jgi:hypothetical protein